MTHPRSKTKVEIEAPAWGGLMALVNSYVSNGGFGIDFPASCPDGRGSTGTHTHELGLALNAEIPDIEWPLREEAVPHTLSVLDLVEFCYQHVAEPIELSYHDFFGHSHLSFDRSTVSWKPRGPGSLIQILQSVGKRSKSSGMPGNA